MNFDQANALNRSIRTIAIQHRTLTAAAFGRLGLHPGQDSVLFTLRDHGPLTQTQLGALIGCEPPTVSSMVKKLEASGLVTRRKTKADARAQIVDLTPAGRRLLPNLELACISIAEAATASLPVSSRRRITASLQALATALRTTDSEAFLPTQPPHGTAPPASPTAARKAARRRKAASQSMNHR